MTNSLFQRKAKEKMVDKRGVIEHLKELDSALKDWRKYKETIGFTEVRTNRDKRNMVLHAMLICIQSAIDISNHIIAEKELEVPTTYRETFEILKKERIISKGLANALADLAGFRNILVHIYFRLDLERTYAILQNELIHLERFQRLVKRILK